MSDLVPETVAIWCELGREAGFGERGKFSSIRRASSGSIEIRASDDVWMESALRQK
jgi:hypothetical protein